MPSGFVAGCQVSLYNFGLKVHMVHIFLCKTRVAEAFGLVVNHVFDDRHVAFDSCSDL